MRRVCFVRFDVGGDEVAATAVGVGHRFPAECSISVSQGLELAHHYPVVVHRADASDATPGGTGSAA
jgi:hypothetical protein